MRNKIWGLLSISYQLPAEGPCIDENGNIVEDCDRPYEEYELPTLPDNYSYDSDYVYDENGNIVVKYDDWRFDQTGLITGIVSKDVTLGELQRSAVNIFNGFIKVNCYDAVVGPVPPLDTSFLEYVVNYANNLVEQGEIDDVIPIVAERFKNALENAKLVLETPSNQSQINSAVTKLLEAIQYLEFKQADKSELINLVEFVKHYETNSSKYIQSTYAPFKTALDNARAIIADENEMDNTVVSNAWDALAEAVVKLRLIPNKDALQNLLTEVKAKDLSLYTVDSVKAINLSMNTAQEVLDSEDSTQGEVDDAYTNLLSDYNNLEAINPSSTEDKGTKEKLKTVVNQTANPKTGDTMVVVLALFLFGLGCVSLFTCKKNK